MIEPLHYAAVGQKSRTPGPVILAVVLNWCAVPFAVFPLMAAWHLAGCHRTSERWCVLRAAIELAIGIPFVLILFIFTASAFARPAKRVWQAATVLPFLLCVGAVGVLAAAALSGPWW